MPVSETPLTIREPTSDVRGGVVVVQEAFGVNEHIGDICGRLADEGWLAVAPHLYHRTGDPVLDYGDFASVRPHLSAITTESIEADLDAAFGHLADAGIEQGHTGIVGFCMGGTVALAASARRELGAGVTYYGGGIVRGRFGYPSLAVLAPTLQTPWLGLYGDLDTSIPPEQVDALRAAAAQAAVPTEVVRYADAGHGFNCDRRDAFHEASAADGWSRMLVWLDTYAAVS